MSRLKIGQVDYLNCLPVYHALEEGLIEADYELVKGPPTELNKLFLSDHLVATPISSIEYASNNKDCIVLPDLSISADGKVASILLFSKVPATELEGKKVCLTSSSATSIAMLKILLACYYHVEVDYQVTNPDLNNMLQIADGALLIGDDAMQAHQTIKEKGLDIIVTDLGEVWKSFTGQKMVYAVWVVKKTFAVEHPQEVNRITGILQASREVGLANVPALLDKAYNRSRLPMPLLQDYFKTIHHALGEEERKALLTFFDNAYKNGLIEERAPLNIWGESA